MYTVIVQITVLQPLSEEGARAIFMRTSQNFLNVPGLIRKYYLVSEDRLTIGGCYLWKTREDAERIYTAAWRKSIVDNYGGPEPTVTYFHTNVVVEAEEGRIDTFWTEPAAAA